MKHLLLLATITASIVSSTLSAHATTLQPESTVASQQIGAIALKPQPLPPRYINKVKLLDVTPGGYGRLNPQPLPPLANDKLNVTPGSYGSLNPQPLPPRLGK